MSRQAGSIVRGNSKPRRISVKAGRQQVRLCTAGAAKGQGRRELARIDSRALLAAPVPPSKVEPGARPPRSVGVIPTDATATAAATVRILLALPFALCSAADLNISLTLS